MVSRHVIAARWLVVASVLASAAGGCSVDVNTALQRIAEARRITADLVVEFTKAADASNRAVMAGSDETSVTSARESEQATTAVQSQVDALRPLLATLGYADETRLLDEFVTRYAKYRELDRRILDLAVENTNLKAQRLAFGPGQAAANEFRDALKAVAAAASGSNKWQVEALAATAVATVREMQVLQAPHIADADEAVMTRMEKEMATSEAAARSALASLRTVLGPASGPRLAAATAALTTFVDLNAQVIALSRRNTNVRSLALSLDQKRPLVEACEQSLHALQAALMKHGFTSSR